MKISQVGIDLIKSFEDCVLTAYLCPSNVWTIGYGHTTGVYQGQTITKEQAEQYLKEDIVKYENYVNNTGLVLNQNQFDALVSFTYNCGSGNLKKLIANRSLSEIADAILLYNKSCGTVLKGLVRRREVERKLFLTPVNTNTEVAENEPIAESEDNIMVPVYSYSKSKDGGRKLSQNFQVKEFACNDGSDVIFISPELVTILQAIRSHFNKPVTINSGYRTPEYNKKVGGATQSQHLYGTAADIAVSGVSPKDVAAFAETLLYNRGGIGIYAGFTHIDTRETKSRWNG